jgi:hypothetical protein
MMNASTLPPTYPETRPRVTPTTIASSVAARPITSDMREPKMMAEITSRPWSSVPRRYVGLPRSVQAGGVKASRRLSVRRSKGLCGATHGAKRAARMQATTMAAARITSGERRKL